MKNQPMEKQSPFQSMTNNLGIVLFVARTWATSLEVFLHRGMGERYLGLQAAAVLLLVPLYTIFWRGYDIRPLLLFLPAYLFMCAGQRVDTIARRRRGERIHSMYTGWPRFLGAKAKVTEIEMKRLYEPAITFLFGFGFRYELDAPLGTFFMIGAVCLFISVSVSEQFSRTRSLDLHDAAIDQEIIAERFREMRGDS